MTATPSLTESPRTRGPIPRTMRAGVYRDKGVVRVEEVPVPEVGANEVLIRVAACGICGTDIKKIFQRYVEPPQILGHELAGDVVGGQRRQPVAGQVGAAEVGGLQMRQAIEASR